MQGEKWEVLLPTLTRRIAPVKRWPPGLPHVHPLAAEGHSLGLEQPSLALALRERSVGSHHPLPGHGRIVAGRKHGAGVARSPRREVAVGGHAALGHGANAAEYLLYRARTASSIGVSPPTRLKVLPTVAGSSRTAT